ncbi:hypothetical protein SDC9_89090 [bioreactor metagenome]|uniref:DUF4357 domain-containing protein n=1 Tax=bioreactor metagenome TaxID=1076179 RepID=A0A644ZNE3_9ZZZZ
MSLEVYLTSKDKSCDAKGTYAERSFIVKKGSRIRLDFANHIRGGNTAKSFRDNPNVVDSDGILLVSCTFTSPSTAAQFVTGRSTNGYTAWHVDRKTTLKTHLSLQEINNVDSNPR